jgi:PBP1b-binding outer membrane lipoprotein LpoB
MKTNTILALLMSVNILSGCASTAGSQSFNNETSQSLNSKLIKGRTTKTDVLSQFGEPTSKNIDSNEEIWLYSSVNSKMSAMTYIPIVGIFSNGTDMKTKSLTITFRNEKLYSWSLSEGNSSVHNGL